MNGTIVNDHSLEINNSNYTCPVLCLISGQEIGYQGVFANTDLRAIGQPILGIGKRGATEVGDYYGIGLGYCPFPTNKYCCEIGCIITNNSSYEYRDLVFSTRDAAGDITATERMRIMSNGNIIIIIIQHTYHH
jgi:hypothetical protein